MVLFIGEGVILSAEFRGLARNFFRGGIWHVNERGFVRVII